MTPEQLKLLKDVREILNPSMNCDLVYRSPSYELRCIADKIDYENKVKRDFDRELYYGEHGEYPPEVGNITYDNSDTNVADGTNLTKLN